MYNEIWNKINHPTKAVFFRLLVVYNYGGIYWQYYSKQKVNLHRVANQCYSAFPKDKFLDYGIIVEKFSQSRLARQLFDADNWGCFG